MSGFLEDFADDEVSGVVVSPTYLNGYSYRRTLRIAGSAIPGAAALADFPMVFGEQLPGFKTVANGGNVQSSAGWDIRFEDASGNQLKHELWFYDPVAGIANCWVRIPSLTPGVDQDIFVYYGKPGLSGPEQDVSATGVWQRCLGCWRAPDGRDMTGHGRDMTASGVTTGAIGGQPAAVLTSSSYLELLDTTFMDAKSEFTPFLLVQPTSIPSGNADFVRFGGTASGTGKLGFTHYDQPDIGKALRNYVWLGASTAFLIGPANSAVANHIYTWACAEKSGSWPVQYFDGVAATSTQRGAFGTGSTSYPSTILLRIGAGYGDNTTCVPGKYGRFWVFDSRLSDAFIALLDLSIRFPGSLYGVGDEDSSQDPDRSPILAPAVAQVGAGNTATVDILAHASDPDGNPMTPGTGSPAATLGTTSIVARQLRYVAGGAQGTDRVGITATAGTKTARALLTVTVGPGGGGGGGGNLPVAPDRSGYWKDYRITAGNSVISQDPDNVHVEIKGGTVADSTKAAGIVTIDRPDHINQGMFQPPYTLEYDYTPLDSNSDSGGVFSQLYLLRHTGGGSVNLGSIAPNLSPMDFGWGAVGVTGIRFSFDTKNPSASLANKIRGRACDTSFGASNNYVSPANFALAPGETLQDFVFPRNQATRLAWSIPGDDTVAVTATFPDGSQVSQSWKDSLISTYLGTAFTNIALTSYAGRDAEFANVTWTDGSAPPGGRPLAKWIAAADVLGHGASGRTDVTAASNIPSTVTTGRQYVVANDINLGGRTYTITGGSAGTATYFRGHVPSADKTTWPKVSNGRIRLNGAASIIIRDLCLDGCVIELGDGLNLVQIERNWFCGQNGWIDNGCIESDGNGDVADLLIAYNLYTPKSSSDPCSSCLLSIQAYQSANRGLPQPHGRARVYGTMLYRNHQHDRNDYSTVGSYTHTGDIGRNDDDTFLDLGMTWQENLWTNEQSHGLLVETKYTGVAFIGNTMERNATYGRTQAPHEPYTYRIRHGRLTEDPSTSIDAARKSTIVDGNLWVWQSGQTWGPEYSSEIHVRDGYHWITNNWGVTLADGVQPSVTTTANGKFSVDLFSAHLNWEGYPANSTPGGGQNWMNAGKCVVGGNRGAVRLITSGDNNAFKPDQCRIAPVTGSRTDRNDQVNVSAFTNTDSTTIIVGADYNKVPHRMQAAENGFSAVEVGIDGYDATKYGP